MLDFAFCQSNKRRVIAGESLFSAGDDARSSIPVRDRVRPRFWIAYAKFMAFPDAFSTTVEDKRRVSSLSVEKGEI